MTEFIANSADVYGDVTLGSGSTIWFQSVLRGDSNSISIGKKSIFKMERLFTWITMRLL